VRQTTRSGCKTYEDFAKIPGNPFFGKKVFPGPFPKNFILFNPLHVAV
jgi:hypothetical protein